MFNQLLYDFSSWFVEIADKYPRIVALIFFGLLFYFLISGFRFFKDYYFLRKETFDRVFEARRQAIAHQHDNHSVQHALEPHKEQKIEYIKEASDKLKQIDPLKSEINNFLGDLAAVTSFEKLEQVIIQFLKKHNKLK
jgi:Tfp pilus assembly protein PilO